MKKTVLIAALILTSSFSLAEEKPTAATTCPAVADMAKKIMETRQMGVPMKSMMTISEDPLILQMVEESYEHPAYQTESVKKRTIQSFEDRWYRNCLKAFKK